MIHYTLKASLSLVIFMPVRSLLKIVIEIDYTSAINTVPNSPYNLLHINWDVKMHSFKTNFFEGYPWSKSGYIMVPWEE